MYLTCPHSYAFALFLAIIQIDWHHVLVEHFNHLVTERSTYIMHSEYYSIHFVYYLSQHTRQYFEVCFKTILLNVISVGVGIGIGSNNNNIMRGARGWAVGLMERIPAQPNFPAPVLSSYHFIVVVCDDLRIGITLNVIYLHHQCYLGYFAESDDK